MKLASHIFLLTLYSLLTAGMTVSTHFCGNTPVATGFGVPLTEPDWCCGEDEPMDGCCTTTITMIVMDDDHVTTVHQNPAIGLEAVAPAIAEEPAKLRLSAVAIHPAGAITGDSPPLTILHQRFLI